MQGLPTKTGIELSTRVIAKMTSFTLKLLLHKSLGRDVQTLRIAKALIPFHGSRIVVFSSAIFGCPVSSPLTPL